jgi:hypothetical protein
MAKSKRQMTQAKRAREQSLRERRERKQEKKRAAAALKAGVAKDQPAEEPSKPPHQGSAMELEGGDVPRPTSPSATSAGSPSRHAYCPLCGEARVEIRATAVRDVEDALCPERCLIAWRALEALREQEATSEEVVARRRLEYENGQAHPPALSELLLDRWREGDWTVAPEQVLRQVRTQHAGGTVRPSGERSG